MSRFYFHLFAPDQKFRDAVGCELTDLSAAHSRAVCLANRVMMYGAFASAGPDLSHWTVEIADDSLRPVMTVIFPAHFEITKDRVQLGGARALQDRLETYWNEISPFPIRSVAIS
jgi:hypothetical protein